MSSPQLAGLGRSEMAKSYGISGFNDAKAYLGHAVLGLRLRELCELGARGPADAFAIFGNVDAMRLRSSLTLFTEAAPGERPIAACLIHFFDGKKDLQTMRLLG